MKRWWIVLGLLGLILLVIGIILPFVWPYARLNRLYVLPVVIGCLAVLAFIYMNFNTLRGLMGRRATRYGVGTGVMVIIVLGVVVVIQMLAISYHHRWDVSASGRHRLAPQTMKILSQLEVPIRAYAFFRPGQAELRVLENRLGQFVYQSDNFSFKTVDPDREPGLVKKFQVTSYGTVVVENQVSGKTALVMGVEEDRLINAVVRVTRAESGTIYWIIGHGEGELESPDRTGYGHLAQSLRDEGYTVGELNLMTEEGIPADAAGVILVGPKKPFFGEEAAALKNYLDNGGRVLMMLEPETDAGLDNLLAEYRIRVDQNMVIDQLTQLFGAREDMPVITSYQSHPILKDFDRRMAVLLPTARSVTLTNPVTGIEAQVVAMTSEVSWGETDLSLLKEKGEASFDPDRDFKGPLGVMAVSTRKVRAEGKTERPEDIKRKEARLVVLGDADSVSNVYFGLAGNGDLVLNTIAWLTEEPDLISIRPRKEGAQPILLTRSQGRIMYLFSVIFIPLACLVTGVLVLLRRRKVR